MNSFVAMVRTDGDPADAAAARYLTDGIGTRPLTLDGQAWIVANARIDDRATLAGALNLPAAVASAPDDELILRSYLAWGERCVEHLLGDFSFAIWTLNPVRLFCARDHLGVKPLFYARVGASLAVSDTIDALRRYPGVSDELDDLAVADFLLFGHKTDTRATTFKDIRSVPPAHHLSYTADTGCRVQQYWTLPIDEPRYLRDGEYIEEIRDLVDRAVADRVRSGPVGVFLSGGIDSSILAAAALRHAQSPWTDAVRGYSFFYESLISDDEPRFTRDAASRLGIRCESYVMDADRGWDAELNARTPEPYLAAGGATSRRCHEDMVKHSGVALSGEGADNALIYEWGPYLRHLVAGRRWGRIAADAVQFLRHERRLPRLSAVFRGSAQREADEDRVAIPSWMPSPLVGELDLIGRWRHVMRPAHSAHPTRPVAYFSFALPLWTGMFEVLGPAYAGAPLDVRHPFLDLRVLRFLMSVPVIPWCREKHLLRHAHRDELPSTVLRRPKTPLTDDPIVRKLQRDGIPDIVRTSRLERYVAGPVNVRDESATNLLATLRLAAFSRWLRRIDSAGAKAAST